MQVQSLIALLLTLPLLAAPLPEMDEFEAPPIDGLRRGWTVDTSQREAVRLFWRVRYRATPISGFWRDGNLAQCQPGETLSEHRRAVMARINWYRAMAGVPADMQEDPAATRKAQAAALVTSANARINHEIDPSWICYSEDAKEGAKTSSMALGVTGTEAIDAFMRDAGMDNGGANHRRWLLYPHTLFMGLGDLPQREHKHSASAFTAFDGLYNSVRPPTRNLFVAWPAPGFTPYQTVFARWSFSLPGADMAAAKVSMWQDGQPLTLVQEAVEIEDGEPTIVWRPLGLADTASWPKPPADQHFKVQIDDVKVGEAAHSFNYTVQIFDPDAPHSSLRETSIVGPSQAKRQGSGFGVVAQAGATGYQWRALQGQPWRLDEGAETGFGAFSYSGSNSYPVLDQKVVASGKQAFRLAHNQLGDEQLLLAEPILLGHKAALLFMSRRGVAGRDEVALVEIKVEGQDDWQEIYRQSSDGQMASQETAFLEKKLDLSSFAERMVQLRFRYQFKDGDFFSSEDSRVGWYLDDIRLENAERIVHSTEPAKVLQGRFEFKPDAAGLWHLQARPTVYRAVGDWGPLWAVSVP